MIDVDQYALQKSLFGGTDTEIHDKTYREELHAREKDSIPNPNVNPGQYAPKGGRNPLLKVVQHETGWTASTMLPGGKEFKVDGTSRQHAISQAVRAGEKMGHIFDPPKAEPEIGGLFGGAGFIEKDHPREAMSLGMTHAGQFAEKHDDAPFVLQRPKKNHAVATFDNNTNTKQGGLFDAGKKNELPGQNLLFNSDAGDMHNPNTQENKAKAAKPVTRESFMAQQGASAMGHSEPALHRMPGVKDNRKQQIIGQQADKAADWQTKRNDASSKYDESVAAGEVREPTRDERLTDTAGGMPELESTQAAKRLIEKRQAAKTAPTDGIPRVSSEEFVNGSWDQAHAGLTSEIVASKIAQGMKGIEGREYGIREHQPGKWQMLSRKPAAAEPQQETAKYSRVYEQLERETERYLRENTLCDEGIDRYGMGKHILKVLLSGLAMHAMSHLMGSQGSSGGGGGAKPEAPSMGSGLFEENEHPREQMNAGTKEAGQFAKKPGAGGHDHADPFKNAPKTRTFEEAHPDEGFKMPHAPAPPAPALDPHTAKVAEIWHGPKQGAAQHHEHMTEKAEAKPFLAAPGSPIPEKTAYDTDPRRGTPEQKAAHMAQRQEAHDTNTTAAAWGHNDPTKFNPQPMGQPAGSPGPQWQHGGEKKYNPQPMGQPSEEPQEAPQAPSPRNYPDNLNKPPEQQENYAPPEHPLEAALQPAQQSSPKPPEANWWHDPEFHNAIAKQQQEHTPPEQTEYDHMPAPSPMIKKIQNGDSHSTVKMMSQEHADMHDLGKALHKGEDHDTSMVDEYAYSNGLTPEDVHAHAVKTFHANRSQADGIEHGEHRDLQYEPMQVGGKTPISQVMANPAAAKRNEEPPEPQGPQAPIGQVMANPAADARKPAPVVKEPAKPIRQQTPEDRKAAFDRAKAKIAADAQAVKDAANAKKAMTQQAKVQEKALEFDPAKLDKKLANEADSLGQKPIPSDFHNEDHHANTPKPERFKTTEQWLKAVDKHRKFQTPEFKEAEKNWNVKNGAQKATASKEDAHKNFHEAAMEHDLNHDEFSSYLDQMQSHENEVQDRREGFKSAIKKAWNINNAQANKDIDETHIRSSDQISGELPEADLHEHLGSDPDSWTAKALEMIREPKKEKIGRHDREWVNAHAERFASQPKMDHQDEVYQEPEDGAPFSRKSLSLEVDRYFRQAQNEFRSRKHSEDSRIWTELDSWV